MATLLGTEEIGSGKAMLERLLETGSTPSDEPKLQRKLLLSLRRHSKKPSHGFQKRLLVSKTRGKETAFFLR